MIHVREDVAVARWAFEDRRDAGKQLAAFLQAEGAEPDVVFAVPSGGVAVARAACACLSVPMDMILVRKLPFPTAPEAGFGAITPAGDIVLNDELVAAWGLPDETIERVAADVREELLERERKFVGDVPRQDPKGRRCLLVDDGLASGSTMKAALQEMRRRGPSRLMVGVPCSPARTLRALQDLADDLYCLVAQGPGSFAVASFYRRWHDLTDAEVLALLGRGQSEDSGQEGGGS
jgi:predicted phosphoribosyltransferase